MSLDVMAEDKRDVSRIDKRHLEYHHGALVHE